MTGQRLNRHEVQARIQTAEAKLRGWGVRRLALFGSVVREEAGPESDIDLLVELEPESKRRRRMSFEPLEWPSFLHPPK